MVARVCNTRPLQWLQGQNSFTPCDGRRKEEAASETLGGEDEVEREEESDEVEREDESDEVEEEWDDESDDSSSLEDCDEESEESPSLDDEDEEEFDVERVLLLFLPLAIYPWSIQRVYT
jgi:hypothetical protein